MSLNDVFNAMKREGYIVKNLDMYLLSLNSEDNDRAIDVNAPSQTGACLRARYYARVGEERDANSIDARTRRIFDNGSGMHTRIQGYLKEQGMLLMDEVPVHSYEYNIQGHTDGVLQLSIAEKGVLELKSMNSKNFTDLKAPKPEHVQQGLVYLFCIEERRKYLQNKYKSIEAFNASLGIRQAQYRKLYRHLKSGRKYTAKQKVAFQVRLHTQVDKILYSTKKPVTKAIFLYENKDNQELKEYCIDAKDIKSGAILREVLDDFVTLNYCVETGVVPEREGNCKSSNTCRFCDFKGACWIV